MCEITVAHHRISGAVQYISGQKINCMKSMSGQSKPLHE